VEGADEARHDLEAVPGARLPAALAPLPAEPLDDAGGEVVLRGPEVARELVEERVVAEVEESLERAREPGARGRDVPEGELGRREPQGAARGERRGGGAEEVEPLEEQLACVG